MTQHPSLHIIDQDPGRRARLARLAFAQGMHAEIYDSMAELLERIPTEGVIFVHDAGPCSAVPQLIAGLAGKGRWCPVIAYCDKPSAGQVVAAIKGGALDFVLTPEDAEAIDRAIAGVADDVARRSSIWEGAVRAHGIVSRLSGRERQVLEAVVSGLSNKLIARDLEISPRTVEIHRMKMLAKLGARNAADAVRLYAQAKSYEPLAA